MSAAAIGAAGAIHVAAVIPGIARSEHAGALIERLKGMQADMDRIASGKLPIPPNGRNATASDVQAYLGGRRQTVRAA